MSIFEQLVDQAMRSQPQLAPIRVVVEKELFHHDILRETIYRFQTINNSFRLPPSPFYVSNYGNLIIFELPFLFAIPGCYRRWT